MTLTSQTTVKPTLNWKSILISVAALVTIGWLGTQRMSLPGPTPSSVAMACTAASSACQREIKIGYETRDLFLALSHDFY